MASFISGFSLRLGIKVTSITKLFPAPLTLCTFNSLLWVYSFLKQGIKNFPPNASAYCHYWITGSFSTDVKWHLLLFTKFPYGGTVVKNLAAKQETQVQSLGQEDPLEKEMTTHSSILAWRISWTKEPGRLQSMESQRVRHDWVTFTKALEQSVV